MALQGGDRTVQELLHPQTLRRLRARTFVPLVRFVLEELDVASEGELKDGLLILAEALGGKELGEL
jgi:hypothetical protein